MFVVRNLCTVLPKQCGLPKIYWYMEIEMHDQSSAVFHDPTPYVFILGCDEKTLRFVTQALAGDKLNLETYSSVQNFVKNYQPDRRGCLLLDLQMDNISGPALQRDLWAKNIHIPLIVLTMTADVPTAVEIMKWGAADLLQKPISSTRLLAAVHHAIKHDGDLFRKRKQRADVCRSLDRLTPREREVMELVVTGRANKQIARQLKLSEKTVEIHRSRVMRKMQVDNVPELVLQSVIAAGGTLVDQNAQILI